MGRWLSGRRTRRAVALGAVVITAVAAAGVVGAPAAQAAPPTTIAAALQEFGDPGLGSNVMVFRDTAPLADIQAAFDAVSAQQLTNQFGPERYTLLFEPGTYGTTQQPLQVQVGYYTQVAGLGTSPSDVVVNGQIDVFNQCDANGCIALNNFWRSLSNLTINAAGGSGCRGNTEFWAVSQASPMRRVQVNGLTTLMDYCTAGPQYASGGFIADSAFTGSVVINGSQQQFLVRNSAVDQWTNGVWNQVFSGVTGAPAQSFGQPGAQPYTTIDASPVTRETPYLVTDAQGKFAVEVPATAENTSGTSWPADAAGATLPLSDFFVATPSTQVTAINVALARGRNLLLTPGSYSYSQPIRVTRPGTIVMGLGFATLTPAAGNDALDLVGAPGSTVTGLILDAGTHGSRTLLNVGAGGARQAQPTLISDVFLRVGGATAGHTDTALTVDASHVILDDIWAWRADHGTGVGWTQNTAPTGLVVRGDDVTAYGLFVEHFQRTEVAWSGNDGRVVFFQNEMPYDVPSQSAWNLSDTVKGYPAFAVADGARNFTGYGMGSYSYFNQGQDIHATEAFAVPTGGGTAMHDLLTVFLDGSGGIDSVVNGTGAPVSQSNQGQASTVVTYP